MINENNLILKVDSYKSSQWKQYPPKTERLFSYMSSRGGVYPETIWCSLQLYLKKYLSKPVTEEDVEEAKKFFAEHGVDFNYEGWMYIAKDLSGKLPVRIRAVPEGTRVPVNCVLMTIESTDPKCFWVVNWLESLLLKTWYPTTVATQSYFIRKVIYDALVKTSENPDAEIDFKLHSFGYRGVSSEESAGIGGMAELISFKGTDTIAGIIYANNYYNAGMAGFSINASEHSTITSWGRENEVDAYRNMLNTFGRKGSIFACVSDSYDIYKACKELWGGTLKEEVIKSGCTLVIRPDSGIPQEVVVKCLQILDEQFGSVVNFKGYKVLNNVRVIQGDGINPTSINEIIEAVITAGYSITNLAFGMGGASLQGSSANTMNRDTQKFAFKASFAEIDGKPVNLVKDPITDKSKKSLQGRLDTIRTTSGIKTVILESEQDKHALSIMHDYYLNGEILVNYSFSTVRERALTV